MQAPPAGVCTRIYGKLDVNNRTEAVMRAVSLGWLDADIAAE